MGGLVITAMVGAVFAVLTGGIALMMRGGEANEKYGNKLMVARVGLQALALLLLALLFLAGKN